MAVVEWRKGERRAKVQALVIDDGNPKSPDVAFHYREGANKKHHCITEAREEPMAHGDTLDARHKRGVFFIL